MHPARPVRVRAGAYYYPWWTPRRWVEQPSPHAPQLGWYASTAPAAADRHVAWAKQAGLEFFLVSWLRPRGHEHEAFLHTLLPAVARADFRFAVLYETPLALELPAGPAIDLEYRYADGTTAGDKMVAHFDSMADTFLTHPCCLRHDGRPVVEVYLVRDMRNADPYLARIRDRLRGRGVELHLIADVVYWDDPAGYDWPLLEAHFRSITAYNMYIRTPFLPRVRDQFAAADRAARAHGLALVPSVMPGYDDTPLRGGDRVTMTRRAAFYREYWDIAARAVTADQPFVLVTSFNEWHEGTEIEPSAEFGDAYLELTREMIARTAAGPGPTGGPHRWPDSVNWAVPAGR